ncbi:MAG: AAA family ATPase [Proteobacteria bacterium]|nr:AAA family ATPase [Pseudomonadota bacterium]
MAKLRVYELAQDLNMKNKVLLEKLAEMNIPVRSHMSSLDKDTVARIKANISSKVTIRNIKIKNFTVFENEELILSDGLNIILGENSTGKSHLLRLLYSLIESNNTVSRNNVNKIRYSLQSVIPEKLAKIFRPDELNNLIQKGKDSSAINIDLEKYFIKFQFTKTARVEVTINKDDVPEKLFEKKSVFIPEKEILSFYEGFTALYNRREVSFDETYYNLAEALGLLTLKNIDSYPEEKIILDSLEKILGGKILLERGRFYLAYSTKKKTEISLIAEGLRKVGTISHLLANGSLDKNSILFWDEPDSNLNPRLIKKVAKVLLDLSYAGMQLFITTHNLFLIREIEILKNKKNKVNPSSTKYILKNLILRIVTI